MNAADEIHAAAVRFYDALEQLISGKGLAAMKEAWHHGAHVTSGHPAGDWAFGWDEVLATWEVFASFGRAGNEGSRVRDLRVHHSGGDVAYTTCVFTSSPAFGSADLACTNVLERRDGAWKIIHHHADKAPAQMVAAMEKLAAGG